MDILDNNLEKWDETGFMKYIVWDNELFKTEYFINFSHRPFYIFSKISLAQDPYIRGGTNECLLA